MQATQTPNSDGADAPAPVVADFVGKRGRLFRMALRMGVLTVLTLGMYRFWMKTRLRRWYWSGTRVGGTPLEYVGDPYEKLLGFLVAVVILAFYIGVVNLMLMFVSFAFFQGNTAAYVLSLVGVIPLWFYARYRARRYVLARTRWRGVRFGLRPGAWGYALRALWYWALTLLSLGLLMPLMTFRLEQFRADRTFFGSARIVQEGRWTMLYGAMTWILPVPVVAALALATLASGQIAVGILLCLAATYTLLYAVVYYRVEAFRRLTEAKRLHVPGGGTVRLRFDPSPRRVLWMAAWGYALALVAIAVPGLALAAILATLQSAETLQDLGLGDLTGAMASLDRWVLAGLAAMTYFAIFLLWSALTHAFVTMPIWRHYARHVVVEGDEALRAVRQRPRDAHVEAEGFAEALDVGASL